MSGEETSGQGPAPAVEVTILGGFYNEAGGFLSAATLTAKYGTEFAAAFEAGRAMAVPEPGAFILAMGITCVAAMFMRRARPSLPV